VSIVLAVVVGVSMGGVVMKAMRGLEWFEVSCGVVWWWFVLAEGMKRLMRRRRSVA
jgi:hypothetical protein